MAEHPRVLFRAAVPLALVVATAGGLWADDLPCLAANPATVTLTYGEGGPQYVQRVREIIPDKCISIEWSGRRLWTTLTAAGGLSCNGDTLELDYYEHAFAGYYTDLPPFECKAREDELYSTINYSVYPISWPIKSGTAFAQSFTSRGTGFPNEFGIRMGRGYGNPWSATLSVSVNGEDEYRERFAGLRERRSDDASVFVIPGFPVKVNKGDNVTLSVTPHRDVGIRPLHGPPEWPTGHVQGYGEMTAYFYVKSTASARPGDRSCGIASGQTVFTGCGFTYQSQANRDAQCRRAAGRSTSKFIPDDETKDSCGIARGQEVYTGCGYTYQSRSDRDRQCRRGSKTSKFIPNDEAKDSCGIARSQEVYTGCGYTYQLKSDRDRLCGPGTSRFFPNQQSESSCGISRGQEVYTGCGHTYQLQSDRDELCPDGAGTSRFIPSE